jgi:hypothetical protein
MKKVQMGPRKAEEIGGDEGRGEFGWTAMQI